MAWKIKKSATVKPKKSLFIKKKPVFTKGKTSHKKTVKAK